MVATAGVDFINTSTKRKRDEKKAEVHTNAF
jgi:hypothetical protein